MAYNNDTGYSPGSNSIWGATNPLQDSPHTLLYGVGAPYVGIFDREDKPIIEPESGLTLGELCESFSYESVEEGVDSAKFTIHCSNPNILNLKSLQYRANLNLQWGYIPPNPREYKKNNPPFSRVKTMTIVKREITFNDNGVTVNIELKDPHYFLFLTNPSYVGIGSTTPDNLTKFIRDMRNGNVNGVIIGYNYYGTKLTRTSVYFGLPISEEDVKESGALITQPIDKFNKEHYLMFGNPKNCIRVRYPVKDEDGNILTTSYDVMAKLTPEELGYGPIEDSPAYQKLKAYADEHGLVEIRTQDTQSSVQFLYSGSLKGEGNKWQQYDNGLNAALPNGKYYMHGDGSGELKFQNDVVSDAYKVYTYAGGNGELLSFEVRDDFSITQTQVNKSQDIDSDKNINSRTNTQLDGNPTPSGEVLNVYNKPNKSPETPASGTGIGTAGAFTGNDEHSQEVNKAAWNRLGESISSFFDPLVSIFKSSDKSYEDLIIDAQNQHADNEQAIENVSSALSPTFYTNDSNELNTNPNARSKANSPTLNNRALGKWCPTPTNDQVEEFILKATNAWNELITKQNITADSPDELVRQNWENLMKFQYYDIVKEVIVYGSIDTEGHVRGYYDQMEEIIAAGGPSKYFTNGLLTGNNYNFEGEGWSAQVLDVTRETSQEGAKGSRFNTYKVKIKYTLNGEKVINAVDPNSADISLFNDLTRITTHKMEAEAVTIGDPLMEATMNMDIQGVGPYSRRWYVTKITHELSPQRGYICNIEFKPYEITNKQLMLSSKAATQNWLVSLKKAYETVKKEDPNKSQENAYEYWDNRKGEFKAWVNNLGIPDTYNQEATGTPQKKTVSVDEIDKETGVGVVYGDKYTVTVSEVQSETRNEANKQNNSKNEGKNNQSDK